MLGSRKPKLACSSLRTRESRKLPPLPGGLSIWAHCLDPTRFSSPAIPVDYAKSEVFYPFRTVTFAVEASTMAVVFHALFFLSVSLAKGRPSIQGRHQITTSTSISLFHFVGFLFVFLPFFDSCSPVLLLSSPTLTLVASGSCEPGTTQSTFPRRFRECRQSRDNV